MAEHCSPPVILLAHGSQQPEYTRTLASLLTVLRHSDPGLHLAFKELGEPTMAQVISPLARSGHRDFLVLPLFFGSGRHLRDDIPSQIEVLKSDLGICISLGAPLAEQPEIQSALLVLIARLKNPSGSAKH